MGYIAIDLGSRYLATTAGGVMRVWALDIDDLIENRRVPPHPDPHGVEACHLPLREVPAVILQPFCSREGRRFGSIDEGVEMPTAILMAVMIMVAGCCSSSEPLAVDLSHTRLSRNSIRSSRFRSLVRR